MFFCNSEFFSGMSCSKVTRNFYDDLKKVQWTVWTPGKSSWNMGTNLDKKERCTACHIEQTEYLNFNYYNSIFCLNCLEYIFANSFLDSNDLGLIKKQKMELKKEIQDLRPLIMEAKKLKKTNLDSNVYTLKTKQNELKAKRLNQKQMETNLKKRKQSATLVILREDVKKKSINSNLLQLQWTFFGSNSYLCSNMDGNCKRCNQSNLTTVYIPGNEYRVSFCLDCIRILFQEMKPSKEDYAKQLAEFKAKYLEEEEQHQKAKERRQEEIAKIEALVSQL